jgi:hypothetical protein
MPKKEPSEKSKKPILKKSSSPIAKKSTRKKVHTDAQEEYYAKKSEAIKKVMADAKEVGKITITGRPTTYNEDIASYIIDKVASSAVGLKQLCKDDDNMPDHSTINLWRWKHPDFSVRYQLAKQHQTYLVGEDCEDLSQERLYYHDTAGEKRVDQGYTASQRLIIDTKKWHSGKLNPTVFGDRKAIEQLQNEHEQTKAELMALKAQLAMVNKKEY